MIIKAILSMQIYLSIFIKPFKPMYLDKIIFSYAKKTKMIIYFSKYRCQANLEYDRYLWVNDG